MLTLTQGEFSKKKKRGGTHRIGWDLTDIAKGEVLPAVIDVISATIRAEIVRGDEDRLGDHQLAPRVGPA
jgi:hypothetical protein